SGGPVGLMKPTRMSPAHAAVTAPKTVTAMRMPLIQRTHLLPFVTTGPVSAPLAVGAQVRDLHSGRLRRREPPSRASASRVSSVCRCGSVLYRRYRRRLEASLRARETDDTRSHASRHRRDTHCG